MAREFEIIGAGAIGALLHRKAKHAPAPGAACANCATVLAGPYCHVCGQDADDHHRSIAHLAWEGIEGLTHLDGRLAQTVPLLLFRPGRLARDHLEGRRARHVPPFRLFLITLLIFMFVLESLFHQATMKGAHVTPAGPAIASVQMSNTNIVLATPKQARAMINAQNGAAPPGKTAGATDQNKDPALTSPRGRWLHDHIRRAVANKEFYTMVLFTWAHRLAILLLPILAALLALTYIRRRQFFVYDHLIVAMQFLSFEFLIFAAAWLVPDPVGGWALLVATLWTPVNLFMTLRGAYGSGVITAGLKTLFLWFSTLFLFLALMLGLLTLALAEM
jgi:hypothetical protein